MDELNAIYFAPKWWLYVIIWLPRTTDISTYFAQSLEIRGIESRLYMHSEILTCPKSNCKLYKRKLKTHHHIFALFLQIVHAIVKLLPGFQQQKLIFNC